MKPRELYNELVRMFPLRWEMTRAFRLPSDTPDQPYYIMWNAGSRPGGEGWVDSRLDENGVLLTAQGLYSGVPIAQFGFHAYAEFMQSKSDAARQRFLAQARYLRDSQRDDGGYPYSMPIPAYDAQPDWLSGMTQGEAASLMLRAYAITGDGTFKERGQRALEPLKRDTRNGGASYLREGEVFFEEVATANPCHILNGHIYAAFAMWEYARFSAGDADIEALHIDAVRTLENWLTRYDADGWSCYDLGVDDCERRHLAPLWYHQFHIAQLHVYARMTGISHFLAVAERWNEALRDRKARAALWKYSGRSVFEGIRRRVTRSPHNTFRIPTTRQIAQR